MARATMKAVTNMDIAWTTRPRRSEMPWLIMLALVVTWPATEEDEEDAEAAEADVSSLPPFWSKNAISWRSVWRRKSKRRALVVRVADMDIRSCRAC